MVTGKHKAKHKVCRVTALGRILGRSLGMNWRGGGTWGVAEIQQGLLQ